MVTYPHGDLPGYTHHGTTRLYPPWYYPAIHHPGIHHPSGYTVHTPRPGVTVTAGSGEEWQRPWAQEGNMAWVGSLSASQSPKGVMVGKESCAELLRSSLRINRMIG